MLRRCRRGLRGRCDVHRLRCDGRPLRPPAIRCAAFVLAEYCVPSPGAPFSAVKPSTFISTPPLEVERPRLTAYGPQAFCEGGNVVKARTIETKRLLLRAFEQSDKEAGRVSSSNNDLPFVSPQVIHFALSLAVQTILSNLCCLLLGLSGPSVSESKRQATDRFNLCLGLDSGYEQIGTSRRSCPCCSERPIHAAVLKWVWETPTAITFRQDSRTERLSPQR